MTKEQRKILKEFWKLAESMPEDEVDLLISNMTDTFQDICERNFPDEWAKFNRTA